MQEKVFNQIVNRGGIPTRADIAELMAAIGDHGEKREEKTQAVRKLFDAIGHPGTQFQGYSAIDDLSDFQEF